MKANWETGNKRGRKQSYRQEVKQKTTQQRKKTIKIKHKIIKYTHGARKAHIGHTVVFSKVSYTSK